MLPDFVPAAIGVVCAVVALVLFGPSNMLIVALAAAIALLIIVRGRKA